LEGSASLDSSNLQSVKSAEIFERLLIARPNAACSSFNNVDIAEGFERGGNQEFVQFLYIAKGSCGELRSQLYVALDQDYVDQKALQMTC
jgi:hypothetical protein